MISSLDHLVLTVQSIEKTVEFYTTVLGMDRVKSQGVVIIEGIVSRTGAIGSIKSFYFRDPDQNLIEVSSYA